MPKATRFEKAPVTVTLTGEEWFAIMAQLLRRDLSKKGERIAIEARGKIAGQISDAADTLRAPAK
jgi:hypothetical protein